MKSLIKALSNQAGLGLALIRIMMGIVLVYHGYLKITKLGWAVGFFGKVGIPIPSVSGPFITLLETVGGLALIVGLFTRYLGILYAIQFVVAAYLQWFFFSKGYGGAELELMLLFAGVLLATNGGGAYSLDRKIGRWEP